jgi:hypothetical protein
MTSTPTPTPDDPRAADRTDADLAPGTTGRHKADRPATERTTREPTTGLGEGPVGGSGEDATGDLPEGGGGAGPVGAAGAAADGTTDTGTTLPGSTDDPRT